MYENRNDSTINPNSLIVFDTSALLDVFRYSITSSKRILNYLKTYSDFVWIPHQVKEELTENIEKVKSEHINKYKNLSSHLQREITTAKNTFLNKLTNYKKYNFSGISELEQEVNLKFQEFIPIIEKYKTNLGSEEEIYKEFILNDATVFLNQLIQSEKVGSPFNIVEKLDIIREGELRYKYNIPPGYKDDKNKDGIKKFGDLLLWKEILLKASTMHYNTLTFVLSDTKEDWFVEKNISEVARKELFEEFGVHSKGKQLRIIPMSKFIQSLTGFSDKAVLAELRKEKVIIELSQVLFDEIAYDSIISADEETLANFFASNLDMQIDELSNCEVDKYKVHNITIQNEEENFVYNVILTMDAQFDSDSYYEWHSSNGVIRCNIHCNMYIARPVDEEEVHFIQRIRNRPIDYVDCESISFSDIHYHWLGDSDLVEESIDDVSLPYAQCLICNNEIDLLNDAGNGFCQNCAKNHKPIKHDTN